MENVCVGYLSVLGHFLNNSIYDLAKHPSRSRYIISEIVTSVAAEVKGANWGREPRNYSLCLICSDNTFYNFLLKSWQKRRNMVVSSKSWKFRSSRWFFVIFHEMSHFLQLFAEKLTKMPKHGSFIEELQVLAKSMIFRAFSRNDPFSATFSWKNDQNAETW